MDAIFQDQTTQFIILTIIALVTIVVSIIIYFKQRKHKKLSYKILSNTQLLSLEEQTKKEIQLSYKGKVVEGVKFILLKIRNSGNLPIESKDYEKPITIEFGKETQVLTAEVVKKKPSNLQAMLTIEQHVVTLLPTLLNPSDSIKLKLLVTNYEKNLQVNSRISGVSKIEVMKDSSFRLTMIGITLWWVIWGLGSLLGSFLFDLSFFDVFSYFGIIFYLVTLVSIIAMLGISESRKSFEKFFTNFIKETDVEDEINHE